MFKSDYPVNLLIGEDIARTASVVVNDRSSASYLADGEIVVLDSTDAVLASGSTVSDSPFIRIVQRNGATASSSELVRSLRIDGQNVVSFTGQSYSAPQNQRHHVGYIGSGVLDIDNINDNDYTLRITYKHDKEMWSQRNSTKSYYFTSDASATAEEVARNFAVLIGADTSADVQVERLCNDAGVAGGSTLTLTNASAAATLAAADANVVVGAYVRIGTALTDPVYRVLSVSGLVVTFDQPYEGASSTGTAYEYITAALATAALFGLQLTGVVYTFNANSVGKFKYQRVVFEVSLGNFGDTVVTATREAARGRGTYEQIAELEYYAQGFDGIIDRVGDSAPVLRAAADAGETYDVVSIEWFDKSDGHIISGTKPSKNQCLLAIPDGAAQTTNILAQLNPWMASTPKAFAGVV